MRDLSEAFWLIWFEDAEMDPETFSGCGAEDAARRRYKQLLGNWTCHLMQLADEEVSPRDAGPGFVRSECDCPVCARPREVCLDMAKCPHFDHNHFSLNGGENDQGNV